MAVWEFVEWLLIWILETSDFEFEWDEGNISKSAQKHGVSVNEVEEVFRSGRALPLGIQVSPILQEERYGLIGPTEKNKKLQVAFTFRTGKIRVISARPAHRKERKRYEEIQSQITQSIRSTR